MTDWSADVVADVIHGDAFDVYPALAPVPHVFTSLPDMAEIPGIDFPTWARLFVGGVRMILDGIVDPEGVAIFYQTDRRYRGITVDKGSSIAEAAGRMGARVIWHKVAIHTLGTSLYRPAFSHLIAVSRKARAGRPTPDAWTAGPKAYPDAIDAASLRHGLNYLASIGATHVVDPFAGRGSIAVGARSRGMSSTSIDIDADQCEYARTALAAVAVP